VVRDNGGHMVALNWSMHAIYDVKPGEVFWAASDVGWVVGHSYIVYAPLLHGCTTIVFEGKPVGTPDAGTFWRVIEEHKVPCCSPRRRRSAPSSKEDPKAASSANTICPLPDAVPGGRTGRSGHHRVGAGRSSSVPVIDHWWQTETGWAIAGNPMGLGKLPVKLGSPACRCRAMTSRCSTMPAIRLPPTRWAISWSSCRCRPGCLPTLWNADERFKRSYLAEFPGYYKTADAGLIDEDGYLFIMARTDDIINVAGHRLSTGGMEEVLASIRTWPNAR
jgi:propionyl-CoA synthetase